VPAVLEPVSMSCDNGKRPDGMTLIPWRRGIALIWDFICSDMLAPPNLLTSCSGSSRLANSTEAAKVRKYYTQTSMQFLIYVKTLGGAWGSCTCSVVWRIINLKEP